MSLIESLIGSGIVRPDKKRILPTRRPLFLRPRDVFEIIVALGTEASMSSIFTCTDLSPAEPRTLTSVVLNRWPTEEELAALPQPYRARPHLRDLLIAPEFRASLFRRICDCYPERNRYFLVRIPRCAGEHFLAMASQLHPIFPNDLAQHRENDEHRFIPALGKYLSQFPLTRTLMAWQPHMGPFIQSPSADFPVPVYADIGFQWTLNAPPRRTGDRLVAIIREPASLLLSQINSTIDGLQGPPSADTKRTKVWRARLAANAAKSDAEGLKHIGREILHGLKMRDPICHAIANGTAAEALRAARHQDLELADFGRYDDWMKYTWDVESAAPINNSTPHLALADLAPADLSHLHKITAEDQLFYAAFKEAESKIGDLRYSVRGRDL
jgi:hypothetical protein